MMEDQDFLDTKETKACKVVQVFLVLENQAVQDLQEHLECRERRVI